MDQPSNQPDLFPDDRVRALFTFNRVKDEDLPFHRGEILEVVSATKDPNWVHARNQQGSLGIIPISYVELHERPSSHADWFHGRITRAEVEKLLSPTSDGTYLVRASDTYRGDCTLCVKFGPGVQYYRIQRSGKGYSVDGDDWYPGMQQLIDSYIENDNGLCCRLTKCLPDMQQKRLEFLKQHGWMISRQGISLGEKIGSGEFGEVFRGIYQGRSVAVKCFKKDRNSAEEKLFTYEASLMTTLQHTNLVTFIGMAQDRDEVFLVTEFMENGSLLNYLRSRGRSVITKEDQLRFAVDTCRGMAYLENRGVVHRDLAARNVLLSAEGSAKVADFGLAREVNASEISPVSPGAGGGQQDTDAAGKLINNRIPIKWTAPEAVQFNKFTNKSDMWSFGILLWEIYSFGRMPYPRVMANQVIRNLELGYRMEAPEDCPSEVYQLMRNSWALEPEKRPAFAQLLPQLYALNGGPIAGPATVHSISPVGPALPPSGTKRTESYV